MSNHIVIYKTLVIFLIVITQSCYVNLEDDGFNCDRARGPVVTEQRNLPDFNRVTNAIGADIVLRQDQDQEFLITTSESLLDDITTRVINGELIIDYRGCYRDANIEIYIATPEVEAVYNIGSGDVLGDNTWHAEQMDLRITGSGKIDAEINAQSLYSEITGSGTMALLGAVDQGRLRISGSGDIFAFNLDSNTQEITISGSGNCEVLTHELLEVRISGSGDVYYRGHPQINTSISGSGGVFNAN
jgi:hypothetical protein